MNFYVTGRSNNVAQVEQTFERLKAAGHHITFEWTALPMVKPYEKHAAQAGGFAVQGIQGVIDADVYIIFSHPDGNGVFTELGAALAAHMLQGSPKVYAVGDHKSVAMFHYHPAIIWKQTIEEVFAEVAPEVK